MKVIAVNGSPRKTWNTATLLESALQGAASVGAETELIHLTDLHYRGCQSCFSCKRIGGASFGKCVLSDDLTPVIAAIRRSDGLLIGSPIYLHDVTGMTRSFLERLLFDIVPYDSEGAVAFQGRVPTGFIYTMNVPREKHEKYRPIFEFNQTALGFLNGPSEYLAAPDTYQFDDYNKYAATKFDVDKKRRIRDTEFPETCRQAFEMGRRLVMG
jgi:multimeric flavodoxin WrbA